MDINLELIEKLKERADVSYAEAKKALEKCNGDIIEALIYLEQRDKIHKPCKEPGAWSGFMDAVKRIFKTCNENRLVISKKQDKIVNVCLTIAILVTIIFPPLTIFGLLAALFTGHKIRIEKPDGDELKINKTLEDISNAVSNMGSQVAEAVKKE